MLTSIKAGIAGGIVIFIWSMVSWMVLPWHTATIQKFTDEKAMMQTVASNAPTSGIYFAPSWSAETAAATPAETSTVFAAVQQQKNTGMTVPMIISLITQIVAASLVAWLLSKTSGLRYFSRVLFVTVFGLAAGIVTEIPYWNWFGFDINFVVIAIADLILSWYFAGLVIATLCGRPCAR